MDTNQLLTSSVLDIIFEGRNKEYGAYSLRKDYNKRLKTAMVCTGLIVAVMALVYYFKGPEENIVFTPQVNGTVILNPAMIEEKQEIVPPPKPIVPSPPIVTVQFTTPPRIVRDEDVLPDEMPPAMDDAANVRIDLISKEGMPDDQGLIPPQGTANGIIARSAEIRNNEDSVFTKVEIESSYPGGPKAWSRFLIKTFSYPQNAVDNRIDGTVLIRFIVGINGELSNVEAVSGPEELRSEAIRVIRKSGKWNPAIQNGRVVKSYKHQPVIFRLAGE